MIEFAPTTPMRMLIRRTLLLALVLAFGAVETARAQSLRGSQSGLRHAHRVAQDYDYTFIRTPDQVLRFADAGYLVRVEPNPDFTLHAVSFPYARPEVRLFIQRLANQYRNACGEKLVVTSLTRPLTRQPRNSSDLSVHPTGMAIDLRRSWDGRCRAWLESVLLSLERQGVLDATRERSPAHYHVSLFTSRYAQYVDRLTTRTASNTSSDPVRYEVRRGDSLWTIAREHGLSVDDLKRVNGITGNRIYAGQTIRVPGR